MAEGYDAGVRESEAIERDMVQVRLTDPFRFVVVGTPDYAPPLRLFIEAARELALRAG